jgi:hypothetical protein
MGRQVSRAGERVVAVGAGDGNAPTRGAQLHADLLAARYALPSGESFTFTVHAVHLSRPRIEIQGPQGVQATFDWQAARDAGLGRMCTATLVNDIEDY